MKQSGWAGLAGLDLGQHVLHGPGLEQRKLPHGQVMIVRIGRRTYSIAGTKPSFSRYGSAWLAGVVELGEIGAQQDVLRSGEDPAPARSRRSTSSNSNLVSFHSASASRSSAECRDAAARICGPPRRGLAFAAVLHHRLQGDRTAVAPALLPCGCPWVPPPNWSTQSVPKISTSSGMRRRGCRRTPREDRRHRCPGLVEVDAPALVRGDDVFLQQVVDRHRGSAVPRACRPRSRRQLITAGHAADLAITRQWTPWSRCRLTTACIARRQCSSTPLSGTTGTARCAR